MPETLQQLSYPKEEWEIAKKYIAPAIKHQDLYLLEDVEAKIYDGTFQLWPGKQSAFITEVNYFPQKTTINLLFGGGKYEELEAMLPLIEEFARRIGATRFYGGGRPGWIKKIKHLGFKSENLISKDLEL